jgi:hypothetical protein
VAQRLRSRPTSPYYIEALMKEGSGGDNLAVAVAAPDGSIDQALPIPGKYLSSDKNTGPLIIVTQPLSQTVAEGNSAPSEWWSTGPPPIRISGRKTVPTSRAPPRVPMPSAAPRARIMGQNSPSPSRAPRAT